MFEWKPMRIKQLEMACSYLFKLYGGCDNCSHKLCCRIFSPVILKGEITPIARSIKLKPIDFEKRYLLNVGDSNSNLKMHRYVIKNIPCQFLKDDECSIYNSRPFACSSFPFQVGMETVQIDGIEICPTATLIAEEIRGFLENPDINSEIVWEIRDSKDNKVDTQINKVEDIKIPDEISKPIEESYEKLGISDITSQGVSDIYETVKFLWFLESKGLIGVNK